MKKFFQSLLWLLIFALLLGTGAMFFGILLPYHRAQSEAALSGQMVLEQQLDGQWLLSWPEAAEADRYRVELERQGDVIFRDFVDEDTSLLLPALPTDQTLTLRITPAIGLRTLLGADYRYYEQSLEAGASLADMEISVLDFSVDGDEKTLRMEVQCPEDAHWQYLLLDKNGGLLSEQVLTGSTLLLEFGENGAAPIPEEGSDYWLRARRIRETENLKIIGAPSNDYRVSKSSLEYRKLNPVLEETSKNTLSITWDETRGDHYEVQLLENESWKTVRQISQEEKRSYQTVIEPGVERQYRVISVDAQGEALEISEPMQAQGRSRVEYATVWPIRDLAAYASSAMGDVIGTAVGSQAYCVLEEKNNLFAVRIGDEIGWIDSNYCMINLPEYLGGLCSYQITNSEYAIYAIHEFAIPDITGVVTQGYEDVRQEDGSYLVPLLYPAAKKLLNASKTAWEQGLRLKIYDSFRPYIATRLLYDVTSLYMNSPVPDMTYTGIPASEMDLPAPRDGMDYLSLGWLMTGRMYEQSSFLAKTGSAHNLGIAVDLTLEDRDTGEELKMQSSMHDLSQYSVLPKNNETADLLGSIMHGAGFGGLVSEWWHFQDDHAKSSLGLNQVIEGIHAQGWVKDDTGWRYRGPKGGYHTEETLQIDGKTYYFNADGYVLE